MDNVAAGGASREDAKASGGGVAAGRCREGPLRCGAGDGDDGSQGGGWVHGGG